MGGRQLATFLGFSPILLRGSHVTFTLNKSPPYDHIPIQRASALTFPPIVRHHFFAEKETISFPFSLFIIYLFLIAVSLSFKIIKTIAPFLLFQSLQFAFSEREKSLCFFTCSQSRNCYCVPNLNPTKW